MNKNEKNIYQLYSFLLVYRINNDIDELNRRLEELNKKIDSAKEKKISLNVFRNSSKKGIDEEIAYKKTYIEKIKSNLLENQLSIEDISTTNLEDVIKELFANDESKLQRYMLYLQIFETPLYYDFKDRKTKYEEEQKDFSLSNIATFLSFESNFVVKLQDRLKVLGKKVGLNFTGSFYDNLNHDNLVLNEVCPLALCCLADGNVIKTKVLDPLNNYSDACLSSLLLFKDLPSIVKDENLVANYLLNPILNMSINEINSACFSLLVSLEFISNCNVNYSFELKQLIIERFLKWEDEYKETILLEKQMESDRKDVLLKFDLLNDISFAISEICVK